LPFNLGNDSSSSKDCYHPIYFIACEDKPSTIRFVIQSLKKSGILAEDDSPLPSDSNLKSYVSSLLAKNPQVHLLFYDYPTVAKQAHQKTLALLQKKKQEEEDFSYQSSLPGIKLNAEQLQKDLVKAEMQELIRDHVASNATLQEQLKTCHAVHWVSTKKYSIAELDKQPIQQTFLAEHGMVFDNSLRVRGMGFSVHENGLLLKKPECTTLDQKANELAKMGNKAYLAALLGVAESTELSPVQTKAFLEKTLFVPGYFQDKNANTAFIQALACSPLAKTYPALALHLNGKAFKKEDLDLKLLAEHGIDSVEINRPGQTAELIKLTEGTGTRRLRLFSDYWLDDEDYQRLYKVAQGLGGCSGDKSIEYCLSNFLLPIYEVRKWKKRFADDFKKIAELYSNGNTKITQFFDLLLKLEEVYPGKSLQELSLQLSQLIDADFIAQWKIIIEKLHEKHNYYDKLPQFFFESITPRALIEQLKNRQFQEVAESLQTMGKELTQATFTQALKVQSEEIAAFLYMLYPMQAEISFLSDKEKAQLEMIIQRQNLFSLVTESSWPETTKQLRARLLFGQELSEVLQKPDYPKAVSLLKGCNKSFICSVFRQALMHKAYDLAAFIYLSPATVASIPLAEEEKTLLEFIKLKNYSQVVIGSKPTFFAKETEKLASFSEQVEQQCFELIENSLASYCFLSKSAGTSASTTLHLETLCKTKDLTPAQRLLKIHEILATLTERDPDSFSFHLVSTLQKYPNTYLLLKGQFKLPFGELKEEKYPEHYQQFVQSLQQFSSEREQNKKSTNSL
jgi:hypothetical protein